MSFRIAVFISFLVFVSCTTREQAEYKKGIKAVETGNNTQAVFHFERTTLRSPDSRAALNAARQGFRVSYYELKDYDRAIKFLRFIILRSRDAKERATQQMQLATIYFDHMQNYDKALEEFGKLSSISLDDEQQIKVRFYIAQAYYHKNEFTQSKSEISEMLKSIMTAEMRFNILMLQTNIFVSEKSWTQAIDNYKKLIQLFPDREVSDNLALNLSACYEESDDYKNAISVLEQLKTKNADADYIDLRIKKVIQRSKNQPGAKGFRK